VHRPDTIHYDQVSVYYKGLSTASQGKRIKRDHCFHLERFMIGLFANLGYALLKLPQVASDRQWNHWPTRAAYMLVRAVTSVGKIVFAGSLSTPLSSLACLVPLVQFIAVGNLTRAMSQNRIRASSNVG